MCSVVLDHERQLIVDYKRHVATKAATTRNDVVVFAAAENALEVREDLSFLVRSPRNPIRHITVRKAAGSIMADTVYCSRLVKHEENDTRR
jgi:hypothetical protein